MAHPYAKHSQDRTGHRRAKKIYRQIGGTIPVAPATSATPSAPATSSPFSAAMAGQFNPQNAQLQQRFQNMRQNLRQGLDFGQNPINPQPQNFYPRNNMAQNLRGLMGMGRGSMFGRRYKKGGKT